MDADLDRRSLLLLIALAVLVGVAGGFGAWGFRALIAVVHNFAFLGDLSIVYDANVHTPTGVRGA
ncbi:MAG: hypothetical protein VW644_05660 [Alphaproteobacteria bacterium]